MEFEQLSAESIVLSDGEDLTAEWVLGMTYGTHSFDNGVYAGEHN